MKQQLLHTPEGVRDIYNKECGKKLSLQRRLHNILHLYGYHDIQTPMFEFFDVFRKEIGTISSKELYKFFDREGNTLVLRPDITPSIARAAATIGEQEPMKMRLCYLGNTFINHSSYQGRPKEHTQMGAECIGDDSVEADAEMLAMVVDCLKKAGLTTFQIHVGNAEFFRSLIEETGLESEQEERLRELIGNRNYFGADDYLKELNATSSAKEAIAALPSLVGGVEVLAKAKEIAQGERAIRAIERLEAVHKILGYYEAQGFITYDLSMSGTYGYYTGIVFRGYTYGTGDAFVKGGRYDQLLEKFGRPSPSIGFVVVIDDLMNALNRQKIYIPYPDANTLVLYDDCRLAEAVSLAKELRGKNKNTEIIKKVPELPVERYVEYGERNLAGSMVYLQNESEIRMFNLKTGEEKVINS